MDPTIKQKEYIMHKIEHDDVAWPLEMAEGTELHEPVLYIKGKRGNHFYVFGNGAAFESSSPGPFEANQSYAGYKI